jgi:hypothetical protein
MINSTGSGQLYLRVSAILHICSMSVRLGDAGPSGWVKRIVLDCELKKKIYKPLAQARSLPPLE